MLRDRNGFTLIELMMVVAIMGILVAIAIPQFADLVIKTREGTTKAQLGVLRSAVSIYYADLEGFYPADNLASLAAQGKYIDALPLVYTELHPSAATVHNNDDYGCFALCATDLGTWGYFNWDDSACGGVSPCGGRGHIWVMCSHKDVKGNVWETY